jgi:hypothetical protein
LALLALPVIAAMSLGTPASASPNPGSLSVAQRVGEAISAPGIDLAEPLATVSVVYNRGDVGVGVMYVHDGDYAQGRYDAILPVDRQTDSDPLYWDRAEGVWIGNGYCANLRYWQGYWKDKGGYRGPQDIKLLHVQGESVSRWEVDAFRCA